MSKAIIVSDEVYELLKNGSMIEQEWNEIEVKRPYFNSIGFLLWIYLWMFLMLFIWLSLDFISQLTK